MKHFTALVLALVMAAMLAVSAYAATVVVKYKVYVYTSQLTFKQYDYSSSTTPSTRNLTILADSSLGSGSALYHLKYVNASSRVFGRTTAAIRCRAPAAAGTTCPPRCRAASRWLWPAATPVPSMA